MNFFIKSLLKHKLKDIPDDQLNVFIEIIEKNPEFFQKIAAEIQTAAQAGQSQENAAMSVLQAHQDELKQILGQK